MLKRETVFPGSSQWAAARGSEPALETDIQPPVTPLSVAKRRNRLAIPRMDLPVNIAHSGDHHPPPVIDGSPWKHYKTAYGLEMGGYVAVVCKIPATDRLFSMHSISGPSRAQKVDMLRSLDHGNLLLPEEIFTYEDSSCAITEAAAISLGDLVLVRPDEIQLAAIVGQVLRGVCYLASQGLSHGSITHANVLLTTKGIVKIAGCEGCSSAIGETRKADARALGRVMCWLMGDETETAVGGDESKKGSLRLKDPKKRSAEAVDFLSLTLSVSVQTLAEINELIPDDVTSPTARGKWPVQELGSDKAAVQSGDVISDTGLASLNT
ncbi:Serine/threonine-protein kinase dst2, partial [Diaporthe amygdali]|uniref:Serine/threonine-protein kinase dst2 n=1 Tax=Phomopsis amygdali TaxID=1214568 RepID=UPI0022FDCCD2